MGNHQELRELLLREDLRLKMIRILFIIIFILVFSIGCSNNQKNNSSETVTNIETKNSSALIPSSSIYFDQDEIFSLFDIKKNDVLKKLGDSYEIVSVGVEGSEEGYYYDNIGITIIFDDYANVTSIYCSPKISIKGARAEMTFGKIQDKLGKTQIEETWVETPDNKAFCINYTINNCDVQFLSYYKDGKESMLAVYRKE